MTSTDPAIKPAYFDLTVSDLTAARHSFERVLGWRFGIDGGMGAIKDAPLAEGRPTTQVTIPVQNLDEVLAQVTRNGGKIMEAKMPIPGVGWYATCAEPGGLLFGVIQADAMAK